MRQFNADLVFDRRVIMNVGEIFLFRHQSGVGHPSPLAHLPERALASLCRAAEMGQSRKVWLTAESRGWENLRHHRGVADALISAAGWPVT